MEMKPKALVFYNYLPPWRIDVLNEMSDYFDLSIVFLNANVEGFTYNRELLVSKLNANVVFHNVGFNIGSRPFRFGILRLLRKHKPDFVFSHEYSPTSILVAIYLKLKLFSFRYIITTSDNILMADSAKGLKAMARHFVLSNAKGIVVYSDLVRKWYQDHFNWLQVEVCPNIQNPKTLLSSLPEFDSIVRQYVFRFQLSESKIILYVGRLVDVKGLDLLLYAFADSNNAGYKLVLVGEGNQKKMLTKLAVELGIADRVVFAGYYDSEKLYAWYYLANIFVLPSLHEPFGAVVNEALVFGCPVLASKYIGALSYIDEDVNGKIFDPLDKADFVNTLNMAMLRYHDFNPNRTNLLSLSFDEYVRVFSRF